MQHAKTVERLASFLLKTDGIIIDRNVANVDMKIMIIIVYL